MNVSLSVNQLLYRFNFFFTHLYPLISFCFLQTYLIVLSVALHHCVTTSLFISHAFTPTKNYSPKRQLKVLFPQRYKSYLFVKLFLYKHRPSIPFMTFIIPPPYFTITLRLSCLSNELQLSLES